MPRLPRIIVEDEDLIFISKPSRMDSVDVPGGRVETVSAWLRAERPACARMSEKDEDAGLLNRLDFETSGIIVAAKSELGKKSFLEQTKSGRVEKNYVAIVDGIVSEDSRVSAPIGARGRTANKVRVIEKPRKKDRALEAQTSIRAVSSSRQANISCVDASIFVGRRHQIRAHLSHIGYPLCGDLLYGGSIKNDVPDSSFLLHCYRLVMRHPRSGNTLEVRDPLPDAFLKLRKDLVWSDLLKHIFTE